MSEHTLDSREKTLDRLETMARERPTSVQTARLEIVWFENGDFSLHYHEEHDEGTFDHRWDRHPSDHNTRDHVRPGPDAPTPGDDASHALDWRDVLSDGAPGNRRSPGRILDIIAFLLPETAREHFVALNGEYISTRFLYISVDTDRNLYSALIGADLLPSLKHYNDAPVFR